MKKILFILVLVIVAITAKTQTDSWTMKTYNNFDKGTNYTLTNTIADTFMWYAPRNYPATQSYTVNYDTLSGPHATVQTSLYGRKFDTDSWTQIGSTDTWTTSGTDPTQDVIISNTTANRYNYYMVIIVGSGTGTTTIDRQQLYIWSAGELSDGTATLSAGSFTGVVNVGMSGNLDVKNSNDSLVIDLGTDLHVIDVNINGASKFSVDSTGIVTSAGQVKSANGVDLGTSKALTGTTAITIGTVTATTAITSSDWAIGATGIATGIGNITSDGAVAAASYNFATAAQVTGTADSICVTNVAIPALALGLCVTFKAEADNTAAIRFDLNGVVKDVYEQGGAAPNALDANDIRNATIVTLVYDGTQWIQITPSGN